MTPDVKGFLRDLGLLLGLPVLAAAALLAWWQPWKLPTYLVPAPDDVFSVATGAGPGRARMTPAEMPITSFPFPMITQLCW